MCVYIIGRAKRAPTLLMSIKILEVYVCESPEKKVLRNEKHKAKRASETEEEKEEQ